jgi:hypothetical protein
LEPAASPLPVKKSVSRTAPRRAAARPAPAPLRITSTERVSTDQPASSDAKPERPQPTKLEAQTPAMVPKSPPPAAQNQPPAAPTAASADGQPPVKHNVVVRTFGKVIGKFKKHPDPASSFDEPAPSDSDSRARPATER